MTSNNDAGVNQYIIQEGDTMWEIANQYNSTVEDLIDLNPEVDPDNMLIGQVLNVPEQMPGPWRGGPGPWRGGPGPWRGGPGPWRGGPWRGWGPGPWRGGPWRGGPWRGGPGPWRGGPGRWWEQEAEQDPEQWPGRPGGPPYGRMDHRFRRDFRGRRFRFRERPMRFARPPYYPAQRVCPRGANAYYVQPGDSLYSIASNLGVSMDFIISANPFINFNIPLQVGQIICIP